MAKVRWCETEGGSVEGCEFKRFARVNPRIQEWTHNPRTLLCYEDCRNQVDDVCPTCKGTGQVWSGKCSENDPGSCSDCGGK